MVIVMVGVSHVGMCMYLGSVCIVMLFGHTPHPIQRHLYTKNNIQ